MEDDRRWTRGEVLQLDQSGTSTTGRRNRRMEAPVRGDLVNPRVRRVGGRQMKWDSWFRRRRWEARMDAELRLHLDSQIGDYLSQGLSQEEAELRARREFGPIELAKDECRDSRP